MKNNDIGHKLSQINNLILRQKLSMSADDKNDDYCGVSHAGSCIIAYLYDHNDRDVFQRDIEHEFLVRRSTVSKVLTLLEQKGYIDRVAVDYDHRLKKIVLTQKACNIVDKIKADRKALEIQMTKNINQDELYKFKQTLQKIIVNLSQEDSE